MHFAFSAIAAVAAGALAACGGGNDASPAARSSVISAGSDAAAASAEPGSMTSDAGAPSGDAASKKEAAKIARALVRVSKARQLSILRPVTGRVLERPDLIAWVKARVTKEVPASAIVDEGRVLAMLGFLPVDYDYLGGILGLLDAQLAGLYEPDDGTMYLMADLEGEMADSTLDHELTHALQDQHYDLKTRTKYVEGQSDQQEALAMLSEGDAMSAMVDVLFARQKRTETALDVPDATWRMQAAEMNNGKTASTPAVMKQSLVAPYIDGTLFVQELRREGGWDLVDTAWTHPPTSTEQILHVDKWKSHEAPLDVAAPGPPNPEGEGVDGAAPSLASAGSAPNAVSTWTAAETDIYGELELRILLAQWVGDAAAADLARGWGGDRGTLYMRGDVNAFALHVKQDAGVKLDSAGLFAGMERKLGKPATKGKGVLCFERADRGPLAVRVSGGEMAIVAGGTHVGASSAATSVGSGGSAATSGTSGTSMRSASSCRATVEWAKRVVP